MSESRYRARFMLTADEPMRRRPWLFFGAAALVAILVLLYAGRGLSFHFDEWDFITGRRGTGLDTLLASHNGHPSLVPVAYYKVMLQLFGLETYFPYRLVLVALHVGVAAAMFAVLRARLDDAIALLASVLLLFLGTAWENLIWAFQFGFVLSVLAGLAALLAVDRQTRLGNIVATGFLLLSFASSSLAVPFAVLLAVDLGLRRKWRTAAVVVGIPLLVYAAWYVQWGSSTAEFSNLEALPNFMFSMGAAALAGMAGLPGSGVGAPLMVVAALVLLWSVDRRGASPRLTATLAALLASWALTALARAQYNEPEASRYIYLSVVLILIAGAELIPSELRLSGRRLLIGSGVVLVAALANVAALASHSDDLRAIADAVRPRLTALELARTVAWPEYQPDPQRAPQVRADRYLAAVDAFGSPAFDEAGLVAAPADARAAADEVLRQLVRPSLSSRRMPADPGRCRPVSPAEQFSVPDGGVVLLTDPQASLTLATRRFGDAPAEVPVDRPQGRALRLQFPRDLAERDWQVAVTSDRTVRVCA